MHQVLLVVSLGILGVVVVPYARHHARQDEMETVVGDFRRVETALAAYYGDVRNLQPLADLHGLFGDPFEEHFVQGDRQPGWNGPYLESANFEFAFGGVFDVEVKGASQAWIVLGPRDRLGKDFNALLHIVDNELDGDDDVEHGTVWGDANGIHYGFNYVRP